MTPAHQDTDDRAGGGRFTTTHWSVVLAAGANGGPGAHQAMENLCRTYWYPLYAYVRRRGHAHHDAQDLTQAFFARLLEKQDLQAVSPEKGRFRSFLLASLNHFLINEQARALAAKRGAGRPIVSLDEETTQSRYFHEPVTDQSPEKVFERQWAVALLEQAMANLRQEFAARGKVGVFEQLKEFLGDEARSGDYELVAARLGMSPAAVAVAVHRLRQQYRDHVRTEVSRTVATQAETEEEIRHLKAVLSR